jgi:uncharacterized membrane protein
MKAIKWFKGLEKDRRKSILIMSSLILFQVLLVVWNIVAGSPWYAFVVPVIGLVAIIWMTVMMVRMWKRYDRMRNRGFLG